MIKLARIEVLGGLALRLTFSDGRSGVWNGHDVLHSHDTVLTKPLREPQEFGRAFIEGGALAWPNGLEFAPWTIYAEMDAADLLTKRAA